MPYVFVETTSKSSKESPRVHLVTVQDPVVVGRCDAPSGTLFRQTRPFWVTSPVPELPEITYITGVSVLTKDGEGQEHSIVITVKVSLQYLLRSTT